MTNDPEYDVVVIGAGPAGLAAAQRTAAGGLTTLVLDKKREIGVPVRCGEAIGWDDAQALFKVRPEWVCAVIEGARIVAPDDTAIDVTFGSHMHTWILDRHRFEQGLAVQAGRAGAEIGLKTYVNGLLFNDGAVAGVTARIGDKTVSIPARAVIAADGVESRAARWAGIDSTVSLHDMEVGYQYLLGNVSADNVLAFHFGRQRVPGGYIWVFPKGDGMANVGLAISGDFAVDTPPQVYLDRFVADRFPRAVKLTDTASGVPCAKGLEKLTVDGMVVVGDAARQVNPMTGGGIVSGMKAGYFAADAVADALAAGDVSAKKLDAYRKAWFKSWGDDHRKLYRIKEVVYHLSDDDLNKVAGSLKDIDPAKMTVMKVFTTTLKKHPLLLVDVLRLFAGI